MNEEIVDFIRSIYQEPEAFIPLHAPHFAGNEKKYVLDTIDSTFVSSVGAYVTRFEKMLAEVTGAKHVIATVNGTTALHLALILAGVKPGEEVITQPLTFVATANAISHTGATPVFVDVDRDTMGMSPKALEAFLTTWCDYVDGHCINRYSGKRIAACVPMHTFGFPLRIEEVVAVCGKFGIPVVEDAAESLGSYVKNRHTGTFGELGTFSFNGNKILTSGGGGAIVTNDDRLGALAKHLSTTAKVPHSWEFYHDAVGYNYRLPNLNAALLCAQFEQLGGFLADKRDLAGRYREFFKDTGITFMTEPANSTANYWLNTIIFGDAKDKEDFLVYSNGHKVMTRPIWKLMNDLDMYRGCQTGPLDQAKWLEQRVVNLPSSVRKGIRNS